ncbi:hypothetical protein TTHERM_00448740 (macronuclear) [Tetrahymena thermophila SB210]|uniref:Uncharacterized protein n=1 Tax=Tetrahymena thermophila (strain SB210) TaxID=312017 RepID=Q239E1_TETTS|nr:hypothetical protein TTHERM_00448740 [Tetrahymena thermophila SB210]EAR93029.1 hypothetical protein TTHERM_00448740 [Tetrahymena thermophila SB210]|eukprot:XP_001013274.1 hypothetical protein TTHERM_00448740 [Tetrahymena thermophila SB210]
MDQKIMQQGRIFKNINSINGMKEFASEKSTLKLYVDNTNQSQNSMNNINLNTDRQLQISQRGNDVDLSMSQHSFIYKKTSSRPSSQKVNNLGLKISDLVQKKSNTYKSYLQNQKSINSSNQSKQNEQPCQNYQQRAILNSAKPQKLSSQTYQFQGLKKDNYFQTQNNIIYEKYVKGEVSIIELKRNNNLQGDYLKLSQQSDKQNILDKKITQFSNTFQDFNENQEIFNLSQSQKLTKQNKVGVFQQEQIAQVGHKSQEQIEQAKLCQSTKDQNCQLSKDSEQQNGCKQFFLMKKDSLNFEECSNMQKVSKGINSSFVSIGSKSGYNELFQHEKNLVTNNQMQSASRSNLGCSIYNNSTCSTTPAGIHNPEQITQQLVKQNLMIFNRKELFSAAKSSNTYTNSQKLILRQNQNKNLYKSYLNSQSNQISRQTSVYQKNVATDIERLVAKSNRKQIEKQIQSLDSEISTILVGNQSDRILLSRSIQGNPQIAGMGTNEIKDVATQKLTLNIQNLKNIKENNVENNIDDDIVISPLLEPSTQLNSQQKVGDDKKNFIKDLIQKKNQKQIPLIDAPFFQNKIFQQDTQFEFMEKVYSPKQIKQQFQDSIQVNQLQKQNSLSIESLSHNSPRNNFLTNQIEALSKSQENLKISQIIQKEQEQNQSSIKDIQQQPLQSRVQKSQQPKKNNDLKIKFIDKRFSDNIQQKKQENQILVKASSEAETQTNACEKFLKNMALRPKTGIPYNRNNSLIYTPRQMYNMNQQSNEENDKKPNSQNPVSSQQIERIRTPSQTHQKSLNIKQSNQQIHQFSPWQDNNMDEQYDQEDSLDFIQYTISS